MPRTDIDPRLALRDWLAAKREDVTSGEHLDGVLLFEDRLLTSLHLPELILLIERLLGAPVDVANLRGEDLASIDVIVAGFFKTGEDQ